MRYAKLFPFFMLPLVVVGCAEAADETESTESAATTRRPDFSAAVGSVEVDGQQLCTGAVVDIDENATLGGTSAAGRQVVLSGACVNAMKGQYRGGAVFITRVAGAIVAVPIVALNLAAAAGGLAVGILSNVIPGVSALRPYQGNGATSATLLQTSENGVQYGARTEVEHGSQFGLKTCDNLHWRPQFELPEGVPQPLSSAIAIVNVGGQLLFAATVEAFCAVRAIGHALTLPLAAAAAVLDGIGLIGSGRMVATYALPAGTSTVRVRLTEATSELRINARGFVSATSSDGASCTALLGACTLRPAGGFKAGSFVNIAINTNSFLPKNVYISVPR